MITANSILASLSWALTRDYMFYDAIINMKRMLHGALRSIASSGPRPPLLVRNGYETRIFPYAPANKRRITEIAHALTFTIPEQPKISVIVIRIERNEGYLACLLQRLSKDESIGLPFELFVADVASIQAGQAISSITGIRYKRFEKSRNLGSCIDSCVLDSRGEFVFFLTDGAGLSEGSINALHAAFANNTRIAAIGPLMLSPRGSVYDAGEIFGEGIRPFANGRLDYPEKVAENGFRTVDFCLIPGLMVRRSHFLAIGGFSENFRNSYAMCMDFGLRLRETGQYVAVEPSARLVLPWSCGLVPRFLFTELNPEVRNLSETWATRDRIFRVGWNDFLIRDIDSLPTLDAAPGRIALQLHLFYPELAEVYADYFRNIPYNFDLLISIATEDHRSQCEEVFGKLDNVSIMDIRLGPNVGRDLAPMLCSFSQSLLGYKYFAHFHTKKSPHAPKLEGWRRHLLDTLLGDGERIRRIMKLFEDNENIGMVYPEAYKALGYHWNEWMGNRKNAEILARHLGIKVLPDCCLEFPAGSMFWARTEALADILGAEWNWEMFERGNEASDGTTVHAIERLLSFAVMAKGFLPAIIPPIKTN